MEKFGEERARVFLIADVVPVFTRISTSSVVLWVEPRAINAAPPMIAYSWPFNAHAIAARQDCMSSIETVSVTPVL